MKRVRKLRNPVAHQLKVGQVVAGNGYGIRLVSTGTHSQGTGPKVQTAVVEIGELVEVEIVDGKEVEIERRPPVAEAATGETVRTDYTGADVFEQLQDDDTEHESRSE